MGGIDWQRTVLLMIMPDALARHLALDVLDRVEALGLVPWRYRLVEPGPKEIDELYAEHIGFVWKTYQYRALDLALRLGPSVAILLRDVETSNGEGHRRLEAAKGAGDVHRASPDSIRRSVGSINVLLSLLHSSDSPYDADRETPIFFPAAAAGRYDEGLGEPAETLRDFLRLLALERPREERLFEDVVAALRLKVVTALWEALDPDGRRLAAELEERGVEALAARGAGAALAAHLAPATDPDLVACLACEFEPGAPRVDPETAWRVLNRHRVRTDTWERVVLATSMDFAPFRGPSS